MKATAALLLLFAAPAAAGDSPEAARQAVAAKRWADARRIYTRLAENHPGNSEYLVWAARLAGWMQDFDAAAAAYDRVLAAEPDHLEALLGKAHVRMWEKRYGDAGALLAAAQQAAPSSAEVRVALARFHHYQNQDREAERHLRRALDADPDNQEARALRKQLSLPRPVELRLGFTQDRFSFTSPGNMGSVSAGYAGENGRLNLQYEAWDRFGERVHRGGFSFSRRLQGWWLRGGGMLGPGAVALPRHDYTAGFSRALPGRLVLGADYRFLRFQPADVLIVSPTFEFYLNGGSWLHGVYSRSRTSYRAASGLRTSNDSVLGQYFQQVARRVVMRVGYARGHDSFTALSADRLGRFRAHTYLGGMDVKLSSACSIGLFYGYQDRSSGSHQNTAGFQLVLRR
jgi:YaiO family outer membrane protein